LGNAHVTIHAINVKVTATTMMIAREIWCAFDEKRETEVMCQAAGVVQMTSLEPITV
jgi:hypothetical protein